MTMRCRIVRAQLPSRQGGRFDGALGRHVEECLQCQAEQSRYRSMNRRLAGLAEVTYPVPHDLAEPVLRSVGLSVVATDVVATDPPIESGDARKTAVAAAAGAAVVAASAVVVFGLRRVRAA